MTDIVMSTTIEMFGRGRDPVKVKKLSGAQKARLKAADEQCMQAFTSYMEALQSKSQLEGKLGVVKLREHPAAAKPTPKGRR